MRVNLPLIYKQTDPRWGNVLLGFGTDPSDNLYNFGCVVTCLTMTACYYGRNETPPTINQKLKDKNAFTSATPNGPKDLYVPGGLSKVFTDIKETRTVTPSKLTDGQVADIKNALDQHYPVMIGLDYNPKTPLADYHFVLIVDYNPNDENDFTIADPLTGGTRSLKDYLGWYKPSARNTIESYVVFSGKVPDDNSSMIQVPAKVWPEVVHGSTEWDKTVEEYLPDNDPKKTNFESVQSVVGGYKSRITTIQNELDQTHQKVKELEVEKSNHDKKLADLKDECQRKISLLEQEIKVLEEFRKLKQSYEGTISDLEGRLRVANETIISLKKQLATGENGNDLVSALIELITTINEILKKR